MPEYDVFLKKLFRMALFRFLRLFAPWLAWRIDLSTAPDFIDKELPARSFPEEDASQVVV